MLPLLLQRAARDEPLSSLAARRGRSFATVLSWGRGLDGQTGVEGGPASAAVVPRPTALLDLHGRDIVSLSAGRLSSCAVTASGEAFTWGDGRTGLLGHGSGRASLRSPAPQRVEALYGRASVSAVALGDAHALFVSADGAAFACGENKEGQLGLGTPLEVLAAQHRRALVVAGIGGGAGGGGGGSGGARRIREAALAAIRGNGRPAASLAAAWSSSSSADGAAGAGAGGGAGGLGARRRGGGGGASAPLSPQNQPQQQQTSLRELLYAGRPAGGASLSSSSSSSTSSSPFAAPSPMHAAWAGAGASAQRGGRERAGGGSAGLDGSGRLATSSSSFAVGEEGEEDLGGGGGVGAGWDSGLAPGQVGHPVRVGSDAHALWGDDDVDEEEAGSSGGGGGRPPSSSSSSSLLSERVVAASASRYCSALLTARGEVWTFGSDFNGALGSAAGATWQPGPRRVGGALGWAIADGGGGAVAVATGGGFSAALTREGGVVVWGRLAGEGDEPLAVGKRGGGGGGGGGRPATGSPRGSACSPIPARPVAGAAMPAWALGGGGAAGPRFAAVAAGQRHLLLATDDGRVFAAGSWLDARGRGAGAAPVSRPRLLLDLGCEGGVARLAAGPHASAVVSGDGRLYLWGRLLDRGIAEEAWRAAEGAAVAESDGSGGGAAWASAALQRQRAASDFCWPGFGGDRPRLVPELTGVRDVALGGHHALALCD